MTDIAVVGCGYVGLALARQLGSDGVDVAGVRRSDAGLAAIEATGATAVRADVTDPKSLSALPDAEAVVFAASSGGRGAAAARQVYVDGLSNVIEEYSSRSRRPDRLLYTSSTGVYGDHDGDWVDESTPVDPTTEKTEVLVAAEETARSAPFDATVARFAGLYGPERYRLERYLDGPVTEDYLNMVHRDDAAGALARFIRADIARGETVLVVDDEPVSKPALADWLAEACGVSKPAKRTKAERLAEDDLSTAAERRIRASKRCSNDRLRELGYEFEYPTFREGYRDAVTDYRDDGPSENRGEC